MYVSPSVTSHLGYCHEEFKQIPFYQLFDPSQSEWVKQIAATRLAEFRPKEEDGRFYMDEFQRIAKNGSRIWVESTFRFIRNEEPGEPEIVGISKDITEKKALE